MSFYKYSTATGDAKTEMEKMLEPIDRRPDNVVLISGFGQPGLAEFDEIAADMFRIQSDLDTHAKAMISALSALETCIDSFDVLAFQVRKLYKRAASGKFSAEDAASADDLRQRLAEAKTTFADHYAILARADIGLQEAGEKAEVIDGKRLMAMIDLDIYLAAAPEVLRRYDENYIPVAHRELCTAMERDGLVPGDDRYLKDLFQRRQDFLDRIAVLEGTHRAEALAGQQLARLDASIDEVREQMGTILNHEQAERRQRMAEILIVLDALPPLQRLDARKTEESFSKASAKRKKSASAHMLPGAGKGIRRGRNDR
jgi:hypothetical protein